MKYYAIIAILMKEDIKLCRNTRIDEANKKYYQILVRSLIFLTNIHLDILFFIGCVNRQIVAFQESHLDTTQRIFRYAKKNKNRLENLLLI